MNQSGFPNSSKNRSRCAPAMRGMNSELVDAMRLADRNDMAAEALLKCDPNPEQMGQLIELGKTIPKRGRLALDLASEGGVDGLLSLLRWLEADVAVIRTIHVHADASLGHYTCQIVVAGPQATLQEYERLIDEGEIFGTSIGRPMRLTIEEEGQIGVLSDRHLLGRPVALHGTHVKPGNFRRVFEAMMQVADVVDLSCGAVGDRWDVEGWCWCVPDRVNQMIHMLTGLQLELEARQRRFSETCIECEA